MARRIANSTREHPTAATRRSSGRRPVQVSRVLSRPGETHSPGTYVVSGDLCRRQAGWTSVHPASGADFFARAPAPDAPSVELDVEADVFVGFFVEVQRRHD